MFGLGAIGVAVLAVLLASALLERYRQFGDKSAATNKEKV